MIALAMLLLSLHGQGRAGRPSAKGPVLVSEFIYDNAPFPSAHASTIVETGRTLVAAWFGGTHENHPDVCIWVSRHERTGWTRPVQAADGVQTAALRYPCWNPVLFQPRHGPLLLFYKVGPDPRSWWGVLKRSEDGGKSWSEAERLPEGILGPIKNKPVQLRNSDLLCGSSDEQNGWRVHFERSADLGRTWSSTGPLNDGIGIGAIQPSLLFQKDGSIQAIGRTRQGRLFTISSRDDGRHWGAMSLLDLPNPNSGTDAITLRDGRHLLVYNHTTTSRTPLNVAISSDGTNWTPALTLEDEPGEYSYPAVIQSADDKIHITYTWRRTRIKHVVLDPGRL